MAGGIYFFSLQFNYSFAALQALLFHSGHFNHFENVFVCAKRHYYFFKNIKTLQMFIQYSEMLYIIQKLIKVVKEVTI